jgi:hypothetical protein
MMSTVAADGPVESLSPRDETRVTGGRTGGELDVGPVRCALDSFGKLMRFTASDDFSTILDCTGGAASAGDSATFVVSVPCAIMLIARLN